VRKTLNLVENKDDVPKKPPIFCIIYLRVMLFKDRYSSAMEGEDARNV
jgi:hypothetical protein